jgi:putative ABC transport system permease protein
MGIMIVTGLFVGIWPALRASDTTSMANDLHESGARSSDGMLRQRARSVLVVAQVALAVVLLAAAGLILKSFRRAQQVSLGFNSRGVLTMRITEPSARYDSPEKIARFYDQLLEKLRVLPGVSAVASASPLARTGRTFSDSCLVTECCWSELGLASD